MIVKEFIKVREDRYLVKDSNNLIVSEKEKLQLEKKELILEDINADCGKEATKKIKKINKKIKEVENGTNSIEETASTEE